MIFFLYLLLFSSFINAMPSAIYLDNANNYIDFIEDSDDDKKEIRSIQKKESDDLKFQQTVFAGHNNFFLGATKFPVGNAKDDFALARAHVNRVDGDWNLALQPLAPNADVTINNVKIAAASPCHEKPITKLATNKKNNQVAVAIKIPVGLDGRTKNTIFLMTDTKDGKQLYSNSSNSVRDSNVGIGFFYSDELKDNQVYAALTASGDTVFVAVPPSGKNFGEKFSGIVRLKLKNDVLKNYSFGNVPAFEESAAYKIDLNCHNIANNYPEDSSSVQFASSEKLGGFNPLTNNNLKLLSVSIGEKIDMHWDDVLNRLYIGLSKVSGISANPGSAQSLLIGRLDAGNTLKIKPALDVKLAYSESLFEEDDFNRIIGFKFNDASLVESSILKIRTMHTSSGKSYAIINGGVVPFGESDTVNTKVYALPLIKKAVPSVADGFIAKKDFSDGFIDNANQMTDFNDDNDALASSVGITPKFISKDTKLSITDMQIVGDTVYISVSGPRVADHNTEAGIFASTALFKDNGAIESWTPWQRVAGSTDAVAGFGLDQNTNNFWYLTSADGKFSGDMNTVKMTQWGSGDMRTAAVGGIHDGIPLSKSLQNFGPVYGMYSFDGDTPGFKGSVNDHDQLNMMIVTGDEKVALIETGRNNARGLIPDVFDTTQRFETADDFSTDVPVYIFDSSSAVLVVQTASADLKKLGEITVAEVARFSVDVGNGQENKGWIFVGGEKGIAVLRTDNDGKGWETKKAGGGAIGLSQLKSTDFPVSIDGSPLHWKQLSLKIDGKESLTNIRKIVADEASGKVYVVTRDALLRITMNQADFAAGVIDDANCAVLFDLTTGKIGQSNALNDLANGILKVQNYNDVNQAFALRKNFDQLFDMILIKSDRTAGNEKSTIALATSQGVIVSNEFIDNFNDAADIFFKVPKQTNANKNFDLGPALRFDFINNERGGSFAVGDPLKVNIAQGNLYVTALDKKSANLNVYRFNVNKGSISAIKEPYKNGAIPTDFFYKIGSIDADLAASLEFVGPLDFIATKDEFGNNENDFINAVPILPNPALFLNAGKDNSMIDLGMKFTKGLSLGGMPVRDSASGALYIHGEFGVMVNE